MSVVDRFRELGYRVGWAQGATPDEARDKHREAGWAWEGDTHVEHHVHVKHVDGEPVMGKVPIQHYDAEAAGYVPEHMVLRDDSHEPTIWYVEGPVKGGDVGEPTGYEHSDGTPISIVVRGYFREDEESTYQPILDAHDAIVAELELRAGETPDETSDRQGREATERREAEERAAEES